MADRTVRVRLEVEAAGARREAKGFAGDLKQLEGAVGATGKASDTAGGQLRNLGTETGKAREHVGGLTGMMQKLGVTGGIGNALGGIVAFETVKKIVGGASDLNETISKSQQVFKGSANSILQWSSTSATSMGLSQRAALDGASSFQNLFSQIGLSGDASVKMSKSLVGLASDFASFHNAAPEEVMDALLSATRGEYDALQRFVPTVNAAAIQTRALADSGKSSADALTDAEKATALYEIVTEGAGAATGDFARTSNSAANEQRVFLAELENTAASVGNAVLPAYQGLLGVVNDVGPGTILAAGGVALLSNRIAATGTGVGVFKDLGAAWSLYSEAVQSGAPRTGAALETAKAGMTGLKGVGSAALGLFGGPWGLALTGATVATGYFAGQLSDSRQRTDQLTTALGGLLDRYRESHTLTDQTTGDLLKHDKQLADLVLHSDKYGVSVELMLAAQAGVPGSLDKIKEAQERTRTSQGGLTNAQAEAYNALIKLAEQGRHNVDVDKLLEEQQKKSTEAMGQHGAQAKSLSDMVKSFGPNFENLAGVVGLLTDETKTGKDAADIYGVSLGGISSSAIPAKDALTQYSLIADQVGTSHLNASQKASVYGTVLQDVAHTSGDIEPTLGLLGDVFGQIAGSELAATDKASLLKQAWQAMYQPSIDQNDAVEAFNLSLFTLGDQLDKGSKSLDINNAAGVRNADAVEALIGKNNDLYFANIASGVSAEEAGRQHDANGKKIEEAGRKAGLTTQDVAVLNGKYGDIPKDVSTNIRTTGAEAVLNQLRDMKIAQMALAQGIDIPEARRQFNGSTASGGFGFIGHAAGGPVIGPGGPTDDLIPAVGPGGARYRLSDGEWITRAAAVDYYGMGAMSAINEMVIPRELLNPGVLRTLNRTVRRPKVDQPGDGSQGVAFADGGAVNWPFDVNMSKTKIPIPPTPPEAAAALSFLRAQDGKPYIWASAGPGGYDCSGIVSAVWNILHGKSPYSHTFSTMNEAGFFPKGGFGAPLTAGWSNPGEAGGGSVGHTAGVLVAGMTSVPFESGGGWGGVHVGQGATPVRSFAHIGHFDQGGPLHPGWTAAYNGTGQNEWVSAPGAGGGGSTNVSVTINAGMGADGQRLGQQVADVLRTYIRSTGGNVQVTLGRRGS